MTGQRVCPNCGSTDIGHDSVNVLSRLSLDESRSCADCGYTGIFPEIEAEELERFREEVVDDAEPVAATAEQPFNRGRFLIGLAMLVLGLTASTYSTWGNGLLAGLLSLAVGAAIVFEQIARR